MGLDFSSISLPGQSGNLANWLTAGRTNAANRNLANSQRAWEADMMNTSHYREVQDLISAGLNPVLSADGNGAGTPSVSSPQLVAPHIAQTDFSNIFSSFAQMKSVEQNQQRIDIDNKLAAASIAKNLDDRDLTRAKTILSQKGMVKAQLEGEASSVLSKALKHVKEYFQNPKIRRHDEQSLPLNVR